jgi:hypothetical protein
LPKREFNFLRIHFPAVFACGCDRLTSFFSGRAPAGARPMLSGERLTRSATGTPIRINSPAVIKKFHNANPCLDAEGEQLCDESSADADGAADQGHRQGPAPDEPAIGEKQGECMKPAEKDNEITPG